MTTKRSSSVINPSKNLFSDLAVKIRSLSPNAHQQNASEIKKIIVKNGGFQKDRFDAKDYQCLSNMARILLRAVEEASSRNALLKDDYQSQRRLNHQRQGQIFQKKAEIKELEMDVSTLKSRLIVYRYRQIESLSGQQKREGLVVDQNDGDQKEAGPKEVMIVHSAQIVLKGGSLKQEEVSQLKLVQQIDVGYNESDMFLKKGELESNFEEKGQPQALSQLHLDDMFGPEYKVIYKNESNVQPSALKQEALSIFRTRSASAQPQKKKDPVKQNQALKNRKEQLYGKAKDSLLLVKQKNMKKDDTVEKEMIKINNQSALRSNIEYAKKSMKIINADRQNGPLMEMNKKIEEVQKKIEKVEQPGMLVIRSNKVLQSNVKQIQKVEAPELPDISRKKALQSNVKNIKEAEDPEMFNLSNKKLLQSDVKQYSMKKNKTIFNEPAKRQTNAQQEANTQQAFKFIKHINGLCQKKFDNWM